MNRSVCLAMLGAAGALVSCEQAKEDANPEEVYRTAYAMARNDVRNLRGGVLRGGTSGCTK